MTVSWVPKKGTQSDRVTIVYATATLFTIPTSVTVTEVLCIETEEGVNVAHAQNMLMFPTDLTLVPTYSC